ncbi:MAG: LysR family transcriptional regulator [Erysipelotrichaceae bacterium]|nr:LysR family transcriptional regulator [Erysipelotrichaceae bacterium]
MTLRHLLIFRTVCEEGCHTTHAANKLHMSQPAISLAIKEMEQYYGVLLFDRIGRKLQITEAGKRFLQYAIHITDLFDDMETQLRDWDTKGLLRIGASITIGSQFLPQYVKAFSQTYPETEVHVIIEQTERLIQKLIANELDFALIEGIPQDQNIIIHPYMEDHLAVICPLESNWSMGETISLNEFKHASFLLREPGSAAREVFDHEMEKAGIIITPSWVSMSTTALINAVINGLGISVLPHQRVKDVIKSGKVKAVNVKGISFNRNYSIVYHKDKFLTTSAKSFMDICKNMN